LPLLLIRGVVELGGHVSTPVSQLPHLGRIRRHIRHALHEGSPVSLQRLFGGAEGIQLGIDRFGIIHVANGAGQVGLLGGNALQALVECRQIAL
jgi:hypothetical protein